MGWDRHYRPVISLRPSNGPLGLLAAGLVVVSQVQNCRQLEHYGQRWSPMWNSASNAWRWVAVTHAVSRAACQAAGRSASNQAPSPQRHDFPELHAAVLSGQALRNWKAFAMRVGVQVWPSRLHQRLCANRGLRIALHLGGLHGVLALAPCPLLLFSPRLRMGPSAAHRPRSGHRCPIWVVTVLLRCAWSRG